MNKDTELRLEALKIVNQMWAEDSEELLEYAEAIYQYLKSGLETEEE